MILNIDKPVNMSFFIKYLKIYQRPHDVLHAARTVDVLVKRGLVLASVIVMEYV